MFKIRVQATNKEFALITKAARQQRLTTPQFVTRVLRKFGNKLKSAKIAPRRPASPKQTNPPRRKRNS